MPCCFSQSIASVVDAVHCSRTPVALPTVGRCGTRMNLFRLESILLAVHWCCADFENGPMRTLALTLLTMGMVLVAGNARAQTYDPAFPFCMHVVSSRGGTYQDCSYYTMAQCAASASGRGFQCNPNPFYAGATASVRRNGRRYRQAGSISPAPTGAIQDTYCLQGRSWGYPGNCQFSSYAQCMATASGTASYCGINPQYLFAPQRRGAYRDRY
jgi:hypothetical protein